MDADTLQKLCRWLDNALAKRPDLTSREADQVMGAVLDVLEAEYAQATDGQTPY